MRFQLSELLNCAFSATLKGTARGYMGVSETDTELWPTQLDTTTNPTQWCHSLHFLILPTDTFIRERSPGRVR